MSCKKGKVRTADTVSGKRKKNEKTRTERSSSESRVKTVKRLGKVLATRQNMGPRFAKKRECASLFGSDRDLPKIPPY